MNYTDVSNTDVTRSGSTREVFAFRLYPAQRQRLHRIAHQHGRTESDVMREALGKHLDHLDNLDQITDSASK